MCYSCNNCGKCQQPAEKVIQCPACGAWNIRENKVCRKCGTSLHNGK